jgi:hypothetical protein
MAERKLVSIDVPPATKRRAERVSNALNQTITWAVETQVLYMQEKMLTERLSSEAHRKLYLRRKLSLEDAFREGRPRRQTLKFPDPPSGPHEQITMKLSEPAVRALGNLCALYRCTQGWMLARIFKGHENFALKHVVPENEHELFFAGKWKRPEPKIEIDLNSDNGDDDE